MGEEGENGNGTCPECGGSQVVWDHSQAQVVCRECGHVIEEKLKDMGHEWRSFSQEQEENRSRAGPPVTPTKHDKGLSTEIARSHTDAKGNLISAEQRSKLGRLRKWHRRSKFDDGRSRTLVSALTCISRVCSHIGLSKHIRERASYLYKATAEADLVRGRPSEAAVAAVIYIACAETDTPVSLERIANVAKATKKEANRIHRIIIQKFNLEVPCVSPERHVSGVVGKTIEELEFPSFVEEKVRELVREARKTNCGQNRSRDILVAAAVSLVMRYGGWQYSVKKVADPLGLSRGTVQEAVNQLGEELGDDAISQIMNGS